MQQKAVPILTVLLLLCAGALAISYFFFSESSTSFATAALYSEARKEVSIPSNAPELPTCAQSIEVTVASDVVEKITFVCNDPASTKIFLDKIKSELLWNVLLFEGNVVTLTKVSATP